MYLDLFLTYSGKAIKTLAERVGYFIHLTEEIKKLSQFKGG